MISTTFWKYSGFRWQEQSSAFTAARSSVVCSINLAQRSPGSSLTVSEIHQSVLIIGVFELIMQEISYQSQQFQYSGLVVAHHL
jgi:hypothetical protein